MSDPLFQPDATCPRCGRGPRLAYTRKQLGKWSDEHPSSVVQTYQCTFQTYPGRMCNTIYRIRAGDLHRARQIEPRSHIEG